jgi:biofilm protein TabA
MLICKIGHLAEQIKINDNMQKVIEFMNRNDLGKLPLGRIDNDSDNVYVRIMEYSTIPFEELKFEAHKKYIDIHYVATGKEAIGCIDTEKLAVTDDYNSQKDVIHGRPDPMTDTT